MGKLSTTERRAFFRKSLDEHRMLMRVHIEAMGRGELFYALPLATSIRVLVSEGARSVPILKRMRPDYLALEMRTGKIPEPSFSPLGRAITIMSLPFSVRFSGDGPLSIDTSPDMSDYDRCSLGTWWRKPIVRVPGTDALSRREVILGVADKEGAHSDDEMSENYRRLLNSRSLQFKMGDRDLGAVDVTRFTVGAAGLELLDLLDRYFPASETPPATLDT